MHGDYPRRTTSAVIWLISALIAAFVLELVLLSPWLGASGRDLVAKFPLTIDNLQHGRLWTLLTHSFLHSTGNPFHILFTILGLVFIGRELETLLGSRRLLGVYAGAILLSGLCWTAINWVHGGAHIGAGAALFGFLVVLAGVNPGLQLTRSYLKNPPQKARNDDTQFRPPPPSGGSRLVPVAGRCKRAQALSQPPRRAPSQIRPRPPIMDVAR